MPKPALGRGLGALLGGNVPAAKPPAGPAPAAPAAPASAPATPPAPAPTAAPVPQDRVERVPLARVQPCPFQPRKDFTPETLQELADSIRVQGIIQPLVVRPRGNAYELIAGERRWRAAQLAGLKEVPVIVRQADDRAVLELALIENLQRENLNPIEEAQGYGELIEKFQLRQEDVAGKVGRSRTVVANALRLLKLPAEVQAQLRDGRLSVGHAKVILSLATAPDQRLAADRVVKDGLNVRQTEELVAHLQQPHAVKTGREPGHEPAPLRDAHVVALEGKLRERLGTKVSLRYRQGKGALDIRFYSDDELERILQLLGISPD